MKTEIQKYNSEQIIIDYEERKNKLIKNCDEITRLCKENRELVESFSPVYDPLELKRDQYRYEDNYKKYLNRNFWLKLIYDFNLKKYMLCSEYDKMIKEIEENKFPEFNKVNTLGWIAGLKETIYENVTTLCKQVFENITQGTYYTGGSYNTSKKKKRNNNGIDKYFILYTHDYGYIFKYESYVTITDDIEKCLYILVGNKVPEVPCKDEMRKNKTDIFENEFFKIKIYSNGNTHYWIKNEELLRKLNLIGAGKGKIGENIKIKVFEKEW